MPTPQECQQLKENLADLSSLGKEFDRLLTTARPSPEASGGTALQSGKEEDIQKLEELKQEMTSQKEELREKLWPFPELPRTELEAQYNTQIEILERTGLLSHLSGGELGIRLSSQEYPLPSFQDITRKLREKREILKNKISQGFTQLQITPLLPINTFQQTLGRLLIEHHNNHTLFKAKRDPSMPDEPLDLDVTNPVYVYDQFRDNPRLMYYIKSLDPDNHQGLTKDQLITETQGFNIILTEKEQFLPQENENQIVNQGKPNQRKRIENNKTSIEYLNLQSRDPQYQHESYLIIEDWLTQFITHLEQTNQVSNDWNDHNATWLPGNYLPPTLEERRQNPGSLGRLPGGLWARGDRKAWVAWGGPGDRNSFWGVSSSVRI